MVETNNQLIFLDIETVSSDEMPKLEDIKAPGNYSKPEAILKYQTENQLELYKKQALNSMQGRIICIGWSYNGETNIEIGDTEGDMLYNFAIEMVKLHDEIREPLHFCGWNIPFDLTWLFRKSIQYDLRELRKLLPFNNRFLYTDLMREWSMEYKDYTKLTDVATFLGIPHSTDGGSCVYDWWKKGELQKIHEHCREDISLCISIYDRMYGN
jgi:hypothetical protein